MFFTLSTRNAIVIAERTNGTAQQPAGPQTTCIN
jgi:hypothetical protein